MYFWDFVPVLEGVCFDLRFCLGFCQGERFLRLWNLASRINDQSLTYNTHRVRSDGTQEVIPMGKDSRCTNRNTVNHTSMHRMGKSVCRINKCKCEVNVYVQLLGAESGSVIRDISETFSRLGFNRLTWYNTSKYFVSGEFSMERTCLRLQVLVEE